MKGILFDADLSISLLFIVAAVGCDGLTVAEANVSLVLPKYNYEQALYYNCTNEGFVFPGGETAMTINCESDEQWDYEIPLSGCHGNVTLFTHNICVA